MTNEILHQELLALQEHLSAVHTVTMQIETVKSAAKQVVESVQQIQQEYETHLPTLLDKLLTHNTQQVEQLQTNNREIVRQTVHELVETNTQIAAKYQTQYEQIQSYLGQYEAIATQIQSLDARIQTIDFPERLTNVEKTVTAIHAEIQTDIAELVAVKQHNENHLTAIQEAHQYYVSNFYDQTQQQFSKIATTQSQETEKIIQDFKILQQETEVVFNQQKQNFHVTLQHIEAQSQKAVQQIAYISETLLQKNNELVTQMQQSFILQQRDIQQFVNSYQGLVTYTQGVENKLTTIDFPQKLTTLATQIEQIDQKQQNLYVDLKGQLNKQLVEIDNRLTLQKKQQDMQHQLLENQNLLLQTQTEQVHRHLQQHTNELHKIEIEEIRNQTEFLQKQLATQERMLQYLLIAIVSVGVFSVVSLLWKMVS
jgi:hypothetical protein